MDHSDNKRHDAASTSAQDSIASTDTVVGRIAAVERQLADLDAADAQVAGMLRRRDQRGPSMVYSLRLAPGEVEALELRAAQLGMRPSGLARSLIRVGLAVGQNAGGGSAAVSVAAQRVAESVADLQALLA